MISSKFLKRERIFSTPDAVFSILNACASKENAKVHINRIKANLPPDGEVRIISVTDKQFERMSVFWGNPAKRRKNRHVSYSSFDRNSVRNSLRQHRFDRGKVYPIPVCEKAATIVRS